MVVRGEGVWGRIGGYKEFGGVWRSMDGGVIGEFLVVWGVGSMGGIWKEWGSVGLGVEKCGERCGGDVGKCVGEVRGDIGDMGSSTHFFPHLPPHFPHLPFPPPTLLHTPTHFSTSPFTLSTPLN